MSAGPPLDLSRMAEGDPCLADTPGFLVGSVKAFIAMSSKDFETLCQALQG